MSGSLASALALSSLSAYRGYVYDEETGLYYLRSRYYNPEWQKFVNADSLIQSNLYEYCCNDPIVFRDSDGFESTYIEEEVHMDLSLMCTPPVVFNETIKPGMRKYLNNANDYSYCAKGKTNNSLDCVAAVNDADETKYASKVDTVWMNLVKNATAWGVIQSFDLLQPNDIVFTLKLPKGMKREEYINKLLKMPLWKITTIPKPHIGEVVTIALPHWQKERVAIYHSCSEKLSQDKWDALFYGDTGPNITAPMDKKGNSNWYLYIRP